jgi:hypothetical protein
MAVRQPGFTLGRGMIFDELAIASKEVRLKQVSWPRRRRQRPWRSAYSSRIV